jgi:hypothetical protein
LERGHPAAVLRPEFVDPYLAASQRCSLLSMAGSTAGRRELQAGPFTRGMVDAGFGCAIVDPFTASHLPWRNLQVRPFLPAIKFEWSMIVPNFSPVSSLARDFADEFANSFSQTLSILTRRPAFVDQPALLSDL